MAEAGQSREAGEFWIPSPGEGAGAREGRGPRLPLTCRAKAEPLQRRRAARGLPDGTSWRAGPGRGLHGHWGASYLPAPRARCRLPRAVPPSAAAGRATPGSSQGCLGAGGPVVALRPMPRFHHACRPLLGAQLLQTQPTPGCSPHDAALSAEKAWRTLATQGRQALAQPPMRRAAWAGSRTLGGRAAGALRARGSGAGGGKRRWALRRSAGLGPSFALHWQGGLGQMTPPLHPTGKSRYQLRGVCQVSGQPQLQQIPTIVRNICAWEAADHTAGVMLQVCFLDQQHRQQLIIC